MDHKRINTNRRLKERQRCSAKTRKVANQMSKKSVGSIHQHAVPVRQIKGKVQLEESNTTTVKRLTIKHGIFTKGKTSGNISKVGCSGVAKARAEANLARILELANHDSNSPSTIDDNNTSNSTDSSALSYTGRQGGCATVVSAGKNTVGQSHSHTYRKNISAKEHESQTNDNYTCSSFTRHKRKKGADISSHLNNKIQTTSRLSKSKEKSSNTCSSSSTAVLPSTLFKLQILPATQACFHQQVPYDQFIIRISKKLDDSIKILGEGRKLYAEILGLLGELSSKNYGSDIDLHSSRRSIDSNEMQQQLVCATHEALSKLPANCSEVSVQEETTLSASVNLNEVPSAHDFSIHPEQVITNPRTLIKHYETSFKQDLPASKNTEASKSHMFHSDIKMMSKIRTPQISDNEIVSSNNFSSTDVTSKRLMLSVEKRCSNNTGHNLTPPDNTITSSDHKSVIVNPRCYLEKYEQYAKVPSCEQIQALPGVMEKRLNTNNGFIGVTNKSNVNQSELQEPNLLSCEKIVHPKIEMPVKHFSCETQSIHLVNSDKSSIIQHSSIFMPGNVAPFKGDIRVSSSNKGDPAISKRNCLYSHSGIDSDNVGELSISNFISTNDSNIFIDSSTKTDCHFVPSNEKPCISQNIYMEPDEQIFPKINLCMCGSNHSLPYQAVNDTYSTGVVCGKACIHSDATAMHSLCTSGLDVNRATNVNSDRYKFCKCCEKFSANVPQHFHVNQTEHNNRRVKSCSASSCELSSRELRSIPQAESCHSDVNKYLTSASSVGCLCNSNKYKTDPASGCNQVSMHYDKNTDSSLVRHFSATQPSNTGAQAAAAATGTCDCSAGAQKGFVPCTDVNSAKSVLLLPPLSRTFSCHGDHICSSLFSQPDPCSSGSGSQNCSQNNRSALLYQRPHQDLDWVDVYHADTIHSAPCCRNPHNVRDAGITTSPAPAPQQHWGSCGVTCDGRRPQQAPTTATRAPQTRQHSCPHH